MRIVKQLSAVAAAATMALASAILIESGANPVHAQPASKPLTKITFSLDFIPLGRHAPWYAAIAEGYYKAAGLDVSIIPSQGTAQTVQAIEAGTAQIGLTDLPAVALARAQGVKVKMVAVSYEKAPYAVFSLSPGANVTQIKQLDGLTLGSGAGSFTPKVLAGLMKEHGLDPKTLTIDNIAPPARASALLSGQVPSIELFVMSEPSLAAAAKAKNRELVTFLLADHGLKLYSDGIVTTDAYLSAHPDVVRRFVRASLQGWQFALRHPKKAAEDQIKYVPTLDVNKSVAELSIVKGLAVTPAVRKDGLGSFDAAEMKASLDFMIKYVGLGANPPKAGELYAKGFLPSTPIMP